ncbi:MAG TPA: UDP-N-acetylmuramoyl-tripeptide--D-alanyl-D-alanine ligase [bacterium]|nr:UDP-N-acetylmuramoyl-tripeptide--D-alanyl-D-alanine ligase [bacterium]
MREDYGQLRADVGEPLPLGRLLEWADARLLGPRGVFDPPVAGVLDEPVRGLAIDSRALAAGDLFVALPGERADGHQFLSDVAGKALAALVERPDPDLTLTQLVVESVPRALLSIADGFRRRFPELTVVGITGSVGKTTTKDYLGAVLDAFAPTIVSQGNMNTVYGVPLTLARLRGDTALAVLEMGMQWAGEIASLAEVARPRIGVVTAVGPAHLEFFSDVRAIALAKAELLLQLPPDGAAVLPLECEHFPLLAERTPCPVVTFGLVAGNCRAEVRPTRLDERRAEGSRFEVVWNPPKGILVPPARFEIELPTPGSHHVLSALRAAAAALVLGVPPGLIAEKLAGARITPLRGEVYRRGLRPTGGGGGLTILADTYNANPLSMSAALETLAGLPGRRVAVLGDMLELGPTAPRLHESVGAEAAKRGIAVLVAVGAFAEDIARGARENGLGEIYTAADRHEAGRILKRVLRPGDVLLVKASRALRLDFLLEDDALEGYIEPN